MSTIRLQPPVRSATPLLQRLNSREMLRSLPHEEHVRSISNKREENPFDHHHWKAPPLAPKIMAPLRHSRGNDASHQLQRIECIEIVDVVKHDDDCKNYYVINVYLQHEHSRIPTNQANIRHPILHAPTGRHAHDHHGDHGGHSHGTTPDYTVERRFSDFEKLRHDVWEAVQHPHRHYCTFCDGFLFLMLFSTARFTTLTKTLVRSTGSRSKMLDKFLHKLLSEFQLNRPRCRFSCYATQNLPVLLQDFLFGDESSDPLAGANLAPAS